MPVFVPLHPPRDPNMCQGWLFEALERLNRAATSSAQGQAAILRGEAPDGSGSSLVDLSRFFYKPGLAGGQLAYGGVNARDSLTFSSTAAATKGKIYFDSSKTLAAFDESQGYLGIGTVSPAALLHLYTTSAIMARFQPGTFTVNVTSDGAGTLTATIAGQFAPTGGPRVVPGMYVTSSAFSIPANTQVKHLTTGTILTLTASAAAGTGDVTFQTYVDILQVSDESGRDMTYRTAGAIRFTPGTTNVPLRIDGDTLPIAANVAESARVYLEAGYISGGNAIGSDLQVGGPGHGELSRLYLSSRVFWFARNPASGTGVTIGVVVNPAEFGAGFGFDNNFTIKQSLSGGALCLIASGGSNDVLTILPTGSDSGTSPNKSISYSTPLFKFSNNAKFTLGNAAGGGVTLQGFSTAMSITNVGTGLNHLTLNISVTSWSDSAVSNGIYWGDLTGTSAKRIWHTSAGAGVLDRWGVSSKYHLITNAQAGNADFLAPATIPEVLQIVNSSSTNGADGAVLLKVRTQRSGQTANMQEWITSGGAAKSAINSAGAFAGDTTLVSYEDNLVLYNDETVYY